MLDLGCGFGGLLLRSAHASMHRSSAWNWRRCALTPGGGCAACAAQVTREISGSTTWRSTIVYAFLSPLVMQHCGTRRVRR